ncbi:MAG: ferredoxin reductase [Solirubrobacterales bacterium]
MVERGADPRVSGVRKNLLKAARALTTPLLPDDYIELMNPLWSTRELKGRIEQVRPETEDASTIVVRPAFPWPGHKPGQYLRIGVEIDGRRHWRAYSLTSDPEHPDGLVSITVKHVPEGKMSHYFTRQAQPESLVFLGEVEGTFNLPEEIPGKLFFLSAGSGITPIFSMLRELERRKAIGDVVHLHSERTADGIIFGRAFDQIADRNRGYRRHVNLSSQSGRIKPADLNDLVPDWREREGFASGPSELLDEIGSYWADHGDAERLSMERFQPVIGQGDAGLGTGGTVRFRVTEVEATCDNGVSILVGGEDAGASLPFGCRMGICHTCVGKLAQGKVRDLRTGELGGEEGEMVRTCVNAPEGHVEIDL